MEFSPKDQLRFWSRVSMSDGCWMWLGSKNPDGYGKFWLNGVTIAASRAALLLCGEDLGDWFALHSCDNPSCVNPRHLRSGTHQDNVADAMSRNRLRGAPGPRPRSRGEGNGRAKLTLETAGLAKGLRAAGVSYAAVAKHLGVAESSICRVMSGEAWPDAAAVEVDSELAERVQSATPRKPSRPKRGVRGARNPRSRLTEEDVVAIRRAVRAGESRDVIATRYGIVRGHLNGIAAGKAWSHVPM